MRVSLQYDSCWHASAHSTAHHNQHGRTTLRVTPSEVQRFRMSPKARRDRAGASSSFHLGVHRVLELGVVPEVAPHQMKQNGVRRAGQDIGGGREPRPVGVEVEERQRLGRCLHARQGRRQPRSGESRAALVVWSHNSTCRCSRPKLNIVWLHTAEADAHNVGQPGCTRAFA